MSALCHKRTLLLSFDHLVGAGEERQWEVVHVAAEVSDRNAWRTLWRTWKQEPKPQSLVTQSQQSSVGGPPPRTKLRCWPYAGATACLMGLLPALSLDASSKQILSQSFRQAADFLRGAARLT